MRCPWLCISVHISGMLFSLLFWVQIKPVPEGTFGPVTSLFCNKVRLLSEVCTSARNSAGTFLWRYELNQLKPVEMFTVKLPITSTHNNRNPLFIFFFHRFLVNTITQLKFSYQLSQCKSNTVCFYANISCSFWSV